jgi:hypothetical protein
VKIWFAVSTPIVLWDAAFVLSRPASLPGGSLSWLWAPYRLYTQVDRRFLDLGDAFLIGLSWLNLVEAALGALTLYLSWRAYPRARLLAFSVAIMTIAKTALFFLVEAAGGFAYIDTTEMWRVVFLYAATNGIWIVIPALVAMRLGRELT